MLVSGLACEGDETDIGQCAGTWTITSTDHSHDVGVSCDGGKIPKMIYMNIQSEIEMPN